MPKLASHKTCTGCLACADACNHKAIQIVSRHELLYPVVDNDKCVDCILCEKACPVVSPINLNKVKNMRVYGGWSSDEQIRIAGASGGACTGLSISYILQHEGNVSVYGASLEKNRVYHKRVTTIEALTLLMNSKYIQSDTKGVFRKVREDLRNGMYVLFIGTPCQVAGLYGYLGNKADDEHLMTIELICAGVMSPEALDIHLEMNRSPKLISFRNKEEGQLYSKSQCTTIEREGKPYRFTNRRADTFYQCFSSSILERHACFDCKFAKLTRVADITIGDFWGGNKDFKEYEKGVNVILANNSKADSFVKTSDELELYGSTIGKAISGNPCLFHNRKYISLHPFVVFPEASRKLLPRKIWLDIVTNKNPWRYLWGLYRFLSIIGIKIARKRVVKQYGDILDKWLSGG